MPPVLSEGHVCSGYEAELTLQQLAVAELRQQLITWNLPRSCLAVVVDVVVGEGGGGCIPARRFSWLLCVD